MTEALVRLKVEDAERDQARQAAALLEHSIKAGRGGLFLTQANGEEIVADIPPSLLAAMLSTLSTLVETGEAFLLAPEQEVSPEKAAELLGISRPLVYQRMDTGKLAYRQVGTHRRIRVRDVVSLKASEDRRRRFATSISADTEELEQVHAFPSPSAS